MRNMSAVPAAGPVTSANTIGSSREKSALSLNHSPKISTGKRSRPDIWAPHIVWHEEYIDVTASEAMQSASGNKAPAARDDAKKFLEEFLAGGPMLQTELIEAAKANCISEKTLRRAKGELDVRARKKCMDGGWRWRKWDD
jgi:hypothetical protein